MGFFGRRRETLNEILLREAGLESPAEPALEAAREPPPDLDVGGPPPPFDPFAGTYPAQSFPGAWARAMARPGEFDTMVTVTAPGIQGDAVEFAALEGGDLIVDVETGDAALSPLADAVERKLRAPYRAWGRREEGDLWAVAARSIEVRRFTCELGDRLELVARGGRLQLEADGVPAPGRIAELEQAGETVGPEYAVEASRLDGDFWEVHAEAL